MAGEDQPPTPEGHAPSPRATRRHSDIVRFIERFEALTGIRVQSASAEGLPREFLARAAPPPDVLIERYGYELEPRTHNALRRYEPGREREPWTFGRLLEIRGFGAFSLLDLLEVMAEHGIRSTE
jgi:hypothetical protein